MEELRSTDVLDREIQDDARRKVEKVLKAGEVECDRIATDVALRLEKSRTEKTAEYAKRLEDYRHDMESAIPLEKQRRLVAFVDSEVRAALESWFEGLKSDRKVVLFQSMLEKFREPLAGKKIRATFAGMPQADAERIVKAAFGKDNVIAVVERAATGSRASFAGDGVYVESEDGIVTCRATVDEVRQVLLATKRQELAEALMGGRLPE
jgi:V/A-type H+-transporting ATPase subunit E